MSYPNLYITQEDMDWIDRNVFISHTFPQAWVDRAIKVRALKDAEAKLANTAIPSANRWCGLLGEYLVGDWFDFLEDNNKKDWKSKHDFTNKKTGKRLDVKTNNGKFDLEAECSVLVLKNECNWNGYDGLIFCWYGINSRTLSIRGWITKEKFLEKAEFIKKGVEFVSGTGHKITAKADTYHLQPEFIEPISTLEQF